MNLSNNIQAVVSHQLCNGCGTCVSACSMNAITLVIDKKHGVYVPKINGVKCNQCGNCLSVCPGSSVDFNQLNNYVFGKVPNDPLLGNYVSCYMGHSVDNTIRADASSGGLVTSLLVFLLEQGIIDGALVTIMNEKSAFEPNIIIATSVEEIKSAAQSKYCPVPANKIIKRIIDEKLRVAVVGLPCHIQGIRKFEIINPKLSKQIVAHFGLFCGHCVNFLGTEFVLDKLAINTNNVKKIDYRCGEFPGVMSFALADDTKKSISHMDFWKMMFSRYTYFSPMRCTFCTDGTSELADISFGTAWLPKLAGRKESVCICRTSIGEYILKNAIIKKYIEGIPINASLVIQSEKGIFDFTKKKLHSRLTVIKICNQSTPHYSGVTLWAPKFFDYIEAISIYCKIFLISIPFYRKIIKKML